VPRVALADFAYELLRGGRGCQDSSNHLTLESPIEEMKSDGERGGGAGWCRGEAELLFSEEATGPRSGRDSRPRYAHRHLTSTRSAHPSPTAKSPADAGDSPTGHQRSVILSGDQQQRSQFPWTLGLKRVVGLVVSIEWARTSGIGGER
jgi:hypothetical protein